MLYILYFFFFMIPVVIYLLLINLGQIGTNLGSMRACIDHLFPFSYWLLVSIYLGIYGREGKTKKNRKF